MRRERSMMIHHMEEKYKKREKISLREHLAFTSDVKILSLNKLMYDIQLMTVVHNSVKTCRMDFCLLPAPCSDKR